MSKSLFAVALSGMCCFVSAAEVTKPLTVQSTDKKSAITLQLSEGWKTYDNKDGSVSIEVPRSGVNIQVWALSHASVDEAAKQVGDLIKNQVTKFKANESKTITAAGSAVKMITGSGEEADDGDPSIAEVYFFTVEGKVFMICAHGEGDIPTKSQAILPALLASVKKAQP